MTLAARIDDLEMTLEHMLMDVFVSQISSFLFVPLLSCWCLSVRWNMWYLFYGIDKNGLTRWLCTWIITQMRVCAHLYIGSLTYYVYAACAFFLFCSSTYFCICVYACMYVVVCTHAYLCACIMILGTYDFLQAHDKTPDNRSSDGGAVFWFGLECNLTERSSNQNTQATNSREPNNTWQRHNPVSLCKSLKLEQEV